MAPQRPPRRGNSPPHAPKSKAGGSSHRNGPASRRPNNGPPQARRNGPPTQQARRPAGAGPPRKPAAATRPASEGTGIGPGPERLQKILAHAGVGSRRACEDLILQGRVTVGGQVVKELGTKVDPARQPIAVDGQKVQNERPVYFAVYKPKGYVSTNDDPSGRPRVLDLLPEIPQRVYTVGRLDEMSVGLMLLTNDGDLANKLAHPRFGVEKLYRVSVAGSPTREVLAQLTDGIWLAEGKVRAKRVRAIGKRGESTILELVLAEGKNREVRRMLAKLGHKVMTLTRVAVGPITTKGLTAGQFRPLTSREVDLLRRVAAGQSVPMPWMEDRKPRRDLDRPRRHDAPGPAQARDEPAPRPRFADGRKLGSGSGPRPPARPAEGYRPGPRPPAGRPPEGRGPGPRPHFRQDDGPRPRPHGPDSGRRAQDDRVPPRGDGPRVFHGQGNQGPRPPQDGPRRPERGPAGPPRRPDQGRRDDARPQLGPPQGNDRSPERGPSGPPRRPDQGRRDEARPPRPQFGTAQGDDRGPRNGAQGGDRGPRNGAQGGDRGPRNGAQRPPANRRPGPAPSQEPRARKIIGMPPQAPAPEPEPTQSDRPRPRMKRPSGPGKKPTPRLGLGSKARPKRRRDGKGPSD